MRRESNPGIAAVFLFFLIFFAGSVFVSAHEDTDELFEPAEVVIKLKRTSDLSSIAAQYGLNPTPICQLGTNPLYRMQILGSRSVTEIVSQLRNDMRGRVVY